VDGSAGPCGATQVNSDWNASSGVAKVLNKPSIPAAQVQSDWNATSGVSQIANKPALASVATTGSYADLGSKPAAFPAIRHTLIFDGSTTDPGDGSTLTWDCSAQCTTTWTVPAGVTYFNVTIWSGGAGGSGSVAGTGGGRGGGGGGYYSGMCTNPPGTLLKIQVGPGGSGGIPAWLTIGASGGGDSFIGTKNVLAGNGYVDDCGTVLGGGNFLGSSWPGFLNNLDGGRLWGQANCLAGDQAMTVQRIDLGGCGASPATASGEGGHMGGYSAKGAGGGGSGGYNNNHTGLRGIGFGGIASSANLTPPAVGGLGGAWTSADGYTNCTDGVAPGGGGGGAGVESAGGSNHTGCAGARGEVRVYY
jgi:hypothetical protein